MKDRNYAVVFAHLKATPYLTKEDLAFEYSRGRTESLRELNDGEYFRLVGDLYRRQQRQEELKKARHITLRLLLQYGINTTDWARVNTFCEQAKIAGKPFAKLSCEELVSLSKKLRAMLKKKQDKRRTFKSEYSSQQQQIK